jgi:hypothetical protein
MSTSERMLGAILLGTVMFSGCSTTPRQSEAGKKGPPRLLIAALDGNLDEVKRLVAAGGDINKTSDTLLPPLHAAAMSNRLAVVEWLLKEGANVNLLSAYSDTPLFLAAETGHADMVQLLLKNGAQVNQRAYNDATALHQAADKSNVELVQLLLASGADPNARTRDGLEALHVAAKRTKALETNAITQLLADAAKRPNRATNDPGATGKALGILGRHFLAQGKVQEAAACFVEAKPQLDEGVKLAVSKHGGASRNESWARSFERATELPQRPLGYHQSAADDLLTYGILSGISAALFHGTTPEQYARRKEQAANEIRDLQAALQQCAEYLNAKNK